MSSLEEFDKVVHNPSEKYIKSTNIYDFMQKYNIKNYEDLIDKTTNDLDWFWDEIIDYLNIEFYDDYEEIRDNSEGPQFTKWYQGGTINIAHNVLDRHSSIDSEKRNKVACIWEGEPGDIREITFHELKRQSNRVANALEEIGVEKGDTVGLYMPMVPEIISILYGCFKIGAIATPIFSGFGVDATATRIEDSNCSVLFTGDGFYRRGKEIRIKEKADKAIKKVGENKIDKTIVYNRLSNDKSGIPWNKDRDVLWEEKIGKQSDKYETKELESNHESLLLYSSGTTGRPKGIVHTHAGVLVQCAKEIYFGFDHKPHDRFFWVSDIGWMMGPWTLIGNHTFGGTIFIYEGAPDYPDPDRFWKMIDRHKLTVFGVSPTAIRALRKKGEKWIEGYDLSSLRILGSTGEPWDPESWIWFYENIGNEKAPIINISGGTEICGSFVMPLPINKLKPGTVGGPSLGMDVDIVDSSGKSIAENNEKGYLVARDSCPSMTKSLWEGDKRYIREYWSTWDDIWNHGDWAQKDEDGFWFIHGRADDVLNVAGRKVGPAEIEGALMQHDKVSQAATIGIPDKTTGTAVVSYVITQPNVQKDDYLLEDLREKVGEKVGKPFRPSDIYFVDDLPKTQSGKIVRRIIQSAHLDKDIGDLSSIENPETIKKIKNK